MQLIRSSLNSARGFTLAEFLVVSSLGLLISLMAFSFLTINRNIVGKDTVKTRLLQNLRNSMDIIGADIRVAGENLPNTFPAVEVGGGATGDLYLRRNLIDEILPLCAIAGSGATNMYFAVPGTIPAGCAYSGQTTSFNAWRTYRTEHGGSVSAYIYDSAAKLGEFFTYSNESDTGTQYYITATSGLSRTYPVTTTSIYIIEEWKFSKNGDMLQLIQNNDIANPMDVAFGLTAFSLQINMQDSTAKTILTKSDQWSSIKSIEVTLTGRELYGNSSVYKSLVGKFFPRNILSN